MTIDPRLSYRALGLLLTLQHTEGAETRIDTAALVRAEHREGRDVVRNALAELRATGHIETINVQNSRGHWEKSTRLTKAKSQVAPKTEYQASVTPDTEKPQVAPSPENPASATTEDGIPGVGEPSTHSANATFPQVAPKPEKPKLGKPGDKYLTPTPPSSPNSPTSVVVARTPAHTRARPDLTQLAANALRHDTWQLIRAWRDTHTPPYRRETYDAIAKHADQLLTTGADPTALANALQEWDRRGTARPGLLPHLYDDALKALRAARASAATPVPAPEKPATGRGAKVEGWLALGRQMAAQASNETPLRIIDGGRTA